MAGINDVAALYKSLKQEWSVSKPNLSKCEKLLADLKVHFRKQNQFELGLTNLIFLPTSNSVASKQELILARDSLEIGVQWSIEAKDIQSYERYMAQLKCYYFDYQSSILESEFKYQLLGLNLLFLLSQNRVAEFHTELELLPADIIQQNIYIRHPLSIEQFLMEGSYNKIFLAKGNVPAKNYNFFMDILLHTIRAEIAACVEKAYERITLKNALRMLYLPKIDDVKEFGEKVMKWKLSNNMFVFTPEVQVGDEPIPSQELAEQAIDYARELEMIV